MRHLLGFRARARQLLRSPVPLLVVQVPLLPGGVVPPAPLGPLVLRSSPVLRLLAGYWRARAAVDVAVVAPPADADLNATAIAVEQPIALDHRELPADEGWTGPAAPSTIPSGTIASITAMPRRPGLQSRASTSSGGPTISRSSAGVQRCGRCMRHRLGPRPGGAIRSPRTPYRQRAATRLRFLLEHVSCRDRLLVLPICLQSQIAAGFEHRRHQFSQHLTRRTDILAPPCRSMLPRM